LAPSVGRELRKRSRRPLRTSSGVDFSLQGSSRLIVLTPSSCTQSLERSSRGLLKPDCAPSTQLGRSSRGLLKPDCAPSAPFGGFGRDLLKFDCTSSTTRRSNRDFRPHQHSKLLDALHRRSKLPGVSNSSYKSSRRLQVDAFKSTPPSRRLQSTPSSRHFPRQWP